MARRHRKSIAWPRREPIPGVRGTSPLGFLGVCFYFLYDYYNSAPAPANMTAIRLRMSTTSSDETGLQRQGLGSVLNGYAGLGSAFDELIRPDGGPRSHWQTFTHGLDEIGLDEFTQRW